MRIIPFNASLIPGAASLWNTAVSAELPYKPFTPEEFTDKFIGNPHFNYQFSFAAVEGGENPEMIGFAQGICKKIFLPGETNENTPGYITMIAVHPAHRRKNTAAALLDALEGAFAAAGKNRAEIIFFNPINLVWIIPGTDGHEHPNTPGVLTGSPGYNFFMKYGYTTLAEQNAYHRTLADMKPAGEVEKVAGILAALEPKGIAVELYHPERHHGLNDLFDDLKNEHWRADIHNSLHEFPDRPLLVVSDAGKTVGFAGPVYPQPNGRGFFAGIGVHSAYGGMGIGTALFYRLCETEKERGAVYMTLFTGVSNPARKIYESAGFTVAARWADMRKTLL